MGGAALSNPMGAPGATPDNRATMQGATEGSAFNPDALDAMMESIQSSPESFDLALLDPLRKQIEETPEIHEDPYFAQAAKVLDAMVSVQLERLTELARKAQERFYASVTDMEPITETMIKDERQFEGYDRTKESKRYPSDAPTRDVNNPDKIVLHATRTRTMNYSARLLDMLFPTNDWPVRIVAPPNPKPEDYPGFAQLVTQAKAEYDAQQQAYAQQVQMIQQQGGAQPPPQPPPFEPPLIGDYADACASRMQAVIFGHFERMKLREKAGDVLDATCKLGAGFLHGPFPDMEYRRNFQSGELTVTQTKVPGCEFVPSFRFFYDMAPNLAQSCETFHLNIWNKRQLSEFKAYPNVITTNVDMLLDKEKPSLPPKVTEAITRRNQDSGLCEPTTNVFAVILANLILTPDEYQRITGQEWTSPDMPLVQLWFGDDALPLKFKLTPLEHDWRPPYYNMSLFKKDDTIFGYSVPTMARSGQAFVNGAVNATTANAAAASGPILVTNRGEVVPSKEEWRIRGLLNLNNTNPDRDPSAAIYSITVQSNVQGNLEMLDRALQLMDQDTNYEQILGGNLSGETIAASSLAQLVNLASVFQRKIARNCDNDFMGPFAERCVWFENLYGEDPMVKGPHVVVPIASTQMVSKDITTQHLQALTQLAQAPDFKGFSDPYSLFKANVRMLDIPEKDEIVLPRDKALANQAQMQQGQIDPKLEEIKMRERVEMAKLEQEGRLKVMEIQGRLEERKLTLQADLVALQTKKDVDVTKIMQDVRASTQESEDQRFKATLDATMEANLERMRATESPSPYSKRD